MKTGRIFLLLFSIIIISNSIAFSQTKVRYGNREYYYLNDSEQVKPIDSLVLINYDPYNNDITHQVPLNRYIIGEDYIVYIGLAIFDTPKQMFELYINDENNHDILQTDVLVIKKDIFYKILTKYNGEYNYKIIFKTKKSNYTVVINFVSNNRELLNDFYNNSEFFNDKFHKKIKTKK
ncbi:MAG: hypothetical protein JXL97_02755 [Bacteroidales bacterium]|nr:hypothetical protein [Bacteroidales bacterium]